MKKKEIYVCVTLYHLYLTLLYIGSRNTKDTSEIVLSANDKSIYKQFQWLTPILRENGYKVRTRLRSKTKDVLGLEAIENRRQYKEVCRDLSLDLNGGFLLINFAWNLQYVYSTANLYFKKCNEAVFIEEGVLTTINPLQSKLKVAVKKITGTEVDFYKNKKLQRIVVQKPELYPNTWKEKLCTLDMKALIAKNTGESKNVILTVFLGDLVSQIRTGLHRDIGIIYTQPLSEDGFISEEQKIDYFKKMANYYSKYGTPIIKLHPRDQTEYKFNSKYTVLPAYFPSELLNLLDVEFKYAVGICTSAVLTTNAKYKVNINENFLKDLKFELVPIGLGGE